MTGKPRSLGLDLGDRRIGIAISDPLGLTAAGLETIARKDMDSDVAKVADIAKRHNAVEIIIGLPKNMDGTEGEQAMKVYAFGKKLANATNLPVIYEDDRLSTVSAIRSLTVQDVNTGHNRDLADMQAAAIILQKHLDREYKDQPPSA